MNCFMGQTEHMKMPFKGQKMVIRRGIFNTESGLRSTESAKFFSNNLLPMIVILQRTAKSRWVKDLRLYLFLTIFTRSRTTEG